MKKCELKRETFTIQKDVILTDILYELTAILGSYPNKDLQNEIDHVLMSIQQKKLLVSIVGEYNNGKSSLINALLGETILPMNVQPVFVTTNRISYGLAPKAFLCYNDGQKREVPIGSLRDYIFDLHTATESPISEMIREIEIIYPSELCRNYIEIVDTPGINALGMNVSEQILMETNTILLVISAIRGPFSMYDAECIVKMMQYPNVEHFVVVITHMDLIAEKDRERLLTVIPKKVYTTITNMVRFDKKYNSANGTDLCSKAELILENGNFEVYPVSSFLALQSFKTGNNDMLERSNFSNFKKELTCTLNSSQITRGLYSTQQILNQIAVNLDAIPIEQRVDTWQKAQVQIQKCRTRMEQLEILAEEEDTMLFRRKRKQSISTSESMSMAGTKSVKGSDFEAGTASAGKTNSLPKVSQAEGPKPERYPFTQWHIYGSPSYGIAKNNPEVIFVNEKTGERKTIVSSNRNIVNFPGIEDKDSIEKMLGEGSLHPSISFGADIYPDGDDRYLMRWIVQPDGRFWEDETGFGGASDSEIELYTYIDKNGDFMGPFRLYRVGRKMYYSKD